MQRLKRGRPSPALVISLIALFVALGGSAYAVSKVGTKQLKKNAVTSAKIKNGQVTSADIADGNVSSADIKNNDVSSADLKDGDVSSTDIKDGDVSSADIKDGTVASGDLNQSTIDSLKDSCPSGTTEVLGGCIDNVEFATTTSVFTAIQTCQGLDFGVPTAPQLIAAGDAGATGFTAAEFSSTLYDTASGFKSMTVNGSGTIASRDTTGGSPTPFRCIRPFTEAP